MMTHETAFELTRYRLAMAEQRATLMSRLGELPKSRPFFSFRRQVVALPGIVEVRRASDRERIRRRLLELSAGSVRKAS